MDTRDAEGRIGQVIDRYRLEGVLGAGGFGAVYRARHMMMDRPVALKLLHGGLVSNEDLVERFLREARTLGRLGHPNIVGIHDSGVSSEGEAFLAMELLEGEDLASRLERVGALSPTDAREVISAVLDGLAAAHRAGIVHRDLKPANVFLARPQHGGQEVVKLVDFGISKVSNERMTRTGMVLGTPVYMAPECFLSGASAVDARADIYAVGVMLFELLSGTLPYDAPSYEGLVLKVATEPPPPLASVAPALPAALCAIVDRALARSPDARFASAEALRRALDEVALSDSFAHAPTSYAPNTPSVRAPSAHSPSAHAPSGGVAAVTGSAPTATAPQPRGLLVGAGALAAMLVAGAAAAAVLSAPRETPAPPPVRFAPSAPAPLPVAPVPVAAAPTMPVAPVPVAAPPATPAAPVTPAPSTIPSAPGAVYPPRAAVVTLRAPRIVGDIPITPIYEIFDAALASLERCRGAAYTTAHVHLHVHAGRITLAGPNPNVEGNDEEAARCVGNILRERGPLPSGQGIAQLTVDLPAR